MMQEKQRVHLSKYLSKYLRHAPHELGIELQQGGWVEISVLLKAMATRGDLLLRRSELEQVVQGCPKQRFAIEGDRIRANQGHSVQVEMDFEEARPPAILYHGTARQFMGLIFAEGLRKMSRHHVHLSHEEAAARKVGGRRGVPVVLRVDAEAMSRDGHKFYLARNGVWLADCVPAQYITGA